MGNLLREKQLSRAHEIHAQAKEANASDEQIRKSMEATSVISNDATKVFAVIGLVSFGYFAFSSLRSHCVKENYKYITDPETLLKRSVFSDINLNLQHFLQHQVSKLLA